MSGGNTNSIANVRDAWVGTMFPAPRANPGDGDGLASFLLGLLADQRSWWAQAACRGVGTAHFFPEGKGGDTNVTVATARAKWCSRCPVADLCREKGEHEHGVWGGTSERERQRARRDASGIVCDECGHPCATLGVLRKHMDRFHKEVAA